MLRDYPRVPSFDPWIDHPHGAPVVFAPLFDFALATLALLAGLGPDEPGAVELLAAFVPPVLGALTSVATYALARHVMSRTGALLAALLVALTPAHAWYSRLGFVDHHVAVTLAMVVNGALALSALRVRSIDDPATGLEERGLGRTALLGASLVLACGVLLWNGTMLLVAVLDVALGALFVAGGPRRRRDVAALVGVTHLGAGLVVLAVVPGIVRDTGWPWSAVTLSYLHVALLAGASGVAGIVAALLARGASGRQLLGFVLAAGGVALAALLLQGEMLGRVGDWLLAADPFMGAVQESVSIVRTSHRRFDFSGPRVWMGRFFLVTPLLLALLAWRLARGAWRDDGRLFLLVWATLLFAATLAQRRFAETAAPALAILVADFLANLAAGLRLRLVARGAPQTAARIAVGSAVAFVAALAFAPFYVGLLAVPGRLTALLRAPIGPGGTGTWTAADREEQEGSVDVRLDRTLRRLRVLEEARRAATGAPGTAMNP